MLNNDPSGVPPPLTARERSRISAENAAYALRQGQQTEEIMARTEPISGIPIGRNPDNNATQFRTPSGGIIEAENVGGSQPTGLTPLQRFQNSATSNFTTPPSTGGLLGDVYRIVEDSDAQLYAKFAPVSRGGVIESAEDKGYPLLKATKRLKLISTAVEEVDSEGALVGDYAGASFNVEIDEIMEVGDYLILTLSGTDSERIFIEVELRAVG